MAGTWHRPGGTLAALLSIRRAEGRQGLLTGLLPTLVRDAPYSALYLLFYSRLCEFTALPHFLCGLMAGAAATTAVQPADRVKTELQLLAGIQVLE